MNDDTQNLLAETIADLQRHGKVPADVRWVGFVARDDWHGHGAGWMSWEAFAAVADFDYDAGFGGHEIDLCLRVVGDDWWLERHEYDGSEWWEFKRLPERPAAMLPDGRPVRRH